MVIATHGFEYVKSEWAAEWNWPTLEPWTWKPKRTSGAMARLMEKMFRRYLYRGRHHRMEAQ